MKGNAMPFPPPIVWQVEMPSWVSLRPVRQGNNLVVRVGKELRAIDLASGAERWKTVVDPDGGVGHFLKAYGDLVLTDRRPDPKHLTQVVGVRNGQIVLRTDLRCMVADNNAAVVVGDMLFAVGNDPTTGDVLAGVELAGGQVKVDVSLASGADALALAGDRVVVLNRMGSPGLYSLWLDGSNPQPIEYRRAHDMRLSAGRLLATLGDDSGETHHVQARDLETLQELWTAAAHGPACGLEGNAAAHTEETDGKWALVLREAGTGKVRWRGEPQTGEMPGSIEFAAGYVLVAWTMGITAYRRDDGQFVGQLEMGSTVRLIDGRFYLGGFRTLMCTEAS
jgi:hypothetical protein